MMHGSIAFNPENSPDPAQDSQGFVFFLAMFFLFTPVAILVAIALRGRTETLDTGDLIDNYHRAVLQAEQPGIAPVSRSLLSVNTDPSAPPVTVVTWTRGADAYQNKNNAPDYKDTWVTVAPNLKKFCQDYVRSNGGDPRQLAHRLEQRLGLPPDSGYDTFVEFTVDPSDVSRFFRPCKNPSPATNSCDAETRRKAADLQADLGASDPQKKQELKNHYWFFNNYYGSYAGKDQYPWTSLGYTFDWALNESGDDFIRFGESEFIVSAGAPITFVSASGTGAYCSQ